MSHKLCRVDTCCALIFGASQDIILYFKKKKSLLIKKFNWQGVGHAESRTGSTSLSQVRHGDMDASETVLGRSQ